MSSLSRWWIPLALVVSLPFPGAAQGGPTLSEVETLISQGRILQAREVLEAWWGGQGNTVGRSDRQRSLWLRARLTVDPSMAEVDLRRLVLEFPGGPFSDDALLRLAQGADLRGDPAQARAHYSALVRGYPTSPHLEEARSWLREAGPEVQPAELAPPPGTGPPSSPILPEVGGAFSVQMGAFRNLDGALTLADGLRAEGFQPRVVRVAGSDLIRVRIGHFRDREGADRLRVDLGRAGFESTIVMDAQAEERIG